MLFRRLVQCAPYLWDPGINLERALWGTLLQSNPAILPLKQVEVAVTNVP